MNATVPPTAATKVSHAKELQRLTAIITNQPVPRVEAVPRVGERQPTASTNPTDQQIIRATRFIHQWKTRNNTPLPTINEETEYDDDENVRNSTPLRIQPRRKAKSPQTTPAQRKRAPKLRKEQGRTIEKPRNSAKAISNKKLTHLLKLQTDKDKQILRQQQVQQQLLTKVPIAKLGDVSFVKYNVPTPKGAWPPIISQEEEEPPYPPPQPNQQWRQFRGWGDTNQRCRQTQLTNK